MSDTGHLSQAHYLYVRSVVADSWAYPFTDADDLAKAEKLMEAGLIDLRAIEGVQDV